MGFRDLLYETWSALRSNKGRSALTILGIVIGISAVIAMTSLIGGVKQALVDELGLNQARVVYIDFWSDAGGTTQDDLRIIKENIPEYEFVTATQYGNAKVSTGKKEEDSSVLGVADGFFTAISAEVSSGRVLSTTDIAQNSMVTVLDSTLARNLFGADVDPVGQEIRIGNEMYTIVGIIETSNMLAGQGSAYIPLGVCAQRITGSSSLGQIIGYAYDGTDMDALSTKTESFIREYYHINDSEEELSGTGYVYVQSLESIQRELDSAMLSFQLLMTAVASISLLVGGIGIMNMMLTNVTERIREIGLRKALGARRADITRQFLMESIALCFAGGIIGFIVGFGAASLLSGFASEFADGMTVTPVFDATTIAMVVGICSIIGIVFGYGPARRAAKLDPVESLRYQ